MFHWLIITQLKKESNKKNSFKNVITISLGKYIDSSQDIIQNKPNKIEKEIDNRVEKQLINQMLSQIKKQIKSSN